MYTYPLMGPLYCETPALITSFPTEPINTWSNLFIIGIGILAMVLVARRPRSLPGTGLWILAILLTATGIGSFLWHGWRTETFLIMDALPGSLFLVTFVYLWFRRYYSRWATLFSTALFALAAWFSVSYGISYFKTSPLLSLVPLVIVTGAWLITVTYQETRRAAAFGSGALFLTMIAVGFRTVDLPFCDAFPFGTHFLWHFTLSLAAFLAILALITIDFLRLEGARPARRVRRVVHTIEYTEEPPPPRGF
jgi:hypothetical protein